MTRYLFKKSLILLILVLLLIISNTPISSASFDNKYDILISNCSEPFQIIYRNNPPTAPEINGPTNCKVGISYNWTFFSTDPEGENITYYVDWGDVCGGAEYHGPYASGEEITLNHIYLERNTYIIQSIAIDESGGESPWTYFEVTIPRNRFLQNPFTFLINRILQIFPFLNQFF